MNTAPSLAAPVAASLINVTSVALTAAEQEVENLRSQLVTAQEKAATERTRAEQEAKAALHAKVQSIIADLGAQSAMEAIRIIEVESGIKARPLVSAVPVGKRAFPNALSEDTLIQMKAMLEAGATSRGVAEALEVGVSTVDARKAKWGLTNRGLGGGHPPTNRAPKAKRSKGGGTGTHFSPAKRARIIAALKKPNARVSVIARREGASREGVYIIRRQLETAA